MRPRQRVLDEDLLTPSLTEEHDAAGFQRPWNPYTLLLVTFFSGLPGGGTLLALNFGRLGKPAMVGRTMVLVWLGAVLLYVVVALLMRAGVISAGMESRQIVRFGVQAVSMFLGWFIVRAQRSRWEIFETSGQPKGALLWPVIGALVLGIASTFVIITIVFGLFGLRFA